MRAIARLRSSSTAEPPFAVAEHHHPIIAGNLCVTQFASCILRVGIFGEGFGAMNNGQPLVGENAVVRRGHVSVARRRMEKIAGQPLDLIERTRFTAGVPPRLPSRMGPSDGD